MIPDCEASIFDGFINILSIVNIILINQMIK